VNLTSAAFPISTRREMCSDQFLLIIVSEIFEEIKRKKYFSSDRH
jgi:hypothetical protein